MSLEETLGARARSLIDVVMIRKEQISWSQGLLFFFMLSAFAYTAYFSTARYLGFNAEMLDLGHMSQAIWSAAKGRPLLYTYINGPVSDLAKQSEFIFFLIAPVYALFPSPVTLLVLQAGLYATGAFPLYRLAKRRVESPGFAVLLAVVYLVYPVALTAVLFDFHGDTLAMPLILFALEALDRESAREYAFWLVLAMSCKVYVFVPILALGAVLWLQKQRKFAYMAWTAASVWLGLILLVRIAWLPDEVMVAEGESLSSYLQFYFGNFDLIPQTMALRILGAFVALSPALLLGINAGLWMAPGLLVAAAIFLSSGPNHVYNYTYHHYALVVPFLMAGLVYGAEALKTGRGNRLMRKIYGDRSWKKDIGFTTMLAGVLSLFFVQTPQSPFVFLYRPDSDTYTVSARDVFKRRWLKENVPDFAPVLADSYITPHLTNRETLYSNYYSDGPGYLYGERLAEVLKKVEYVVYDAFSVYARVQPDTIGEVIGEMEFGLKENRDGLLLFSRGESGLEQKIHVLPVAEPVTDKTVFDNGIALVDYQFEDTGSRRYRFRAVWRTTSDAAIDGKMMAVTRLEGLDNNRIVHLPTFALLPPAAWPTDRLVEEIFVYQIAEEVAAGSYAIWLGWYDSRSPFIEYTDARSRIGEEINLGNLEVEK